jgi:Bax protein
MLVIKSLIKSMVLLVLLLGAVLTAGAQNSTYISNHKIMATLLAEHYGIPAPVILAVAAIESSGGVSPVARVLNNHFGVVGRNNFVNSKGKKSRYKQYDNELASYIDFCQIVSRKKFYNKLKDNEDCRLWVKALSRAGYSEEPGQWEKKVYSVLQANAADSDDSELVSK